MINDEVGAFFESINEYSVKHKRFEVFTIHKNKVDRKTAQVGEIVFNSTNLSKTSYRKKNIKFAVK